MEDEDFKTKNIEVRCAECRHVIENYYIEDGRIEHTSIVCYPCFAQHDDEMQSRCKHVWGGYPHGRPFHFTPDSEFTAFTGDAVCMKCGFKPNINGLS